MQNLTKKAKASIALAIILWVAAFADMLFIFVMSSQDREQSRETSNSVVIFVAKTVDPQFSNYSPQKKAEIVGKYAHSVRKAAHFLLYAAMGFLSTTALWVYPNGKSLLKKSAKSLALCTLYAITDELHQATVPGRGPQVSDVFLDSAGALCGILLSIAIYKLVSQKSASL